MTTWKIGIVSSRQGLDVIADFLLDEADDLRHLFFPIFFGDREAALLNVQERLWNEHINDPGSHWIYVCDPKSTISAEGAPSRLVGCCQWRFYQSNPFQNGLPELDAIWWPPGGGRDFTNRVMQQVFVPRMTFMARPHSGMSWIAVREEHRRKGIGSALMRWGLERTDELQLESYIEGTPLGTCLYQACGYVRVAQIALDVKRGCNGNQEYKELEERQDRGELPSAFNALWRPVMGKFQAGEPQKTWTDRISKLDASHYRVIHDY